MACTLCGREAPYNEEDGAPPDSFCPRCKPWEEAYILLEDYHGTLGEFEEIVTWVDQAIVDREEIPSSFLIKLARITSALKTVLAQKE